jgi:hypothetical protein
MKSADNYFDKHRFPSTWGGISTGRILRMAGGRGWSDDWQLYSYAADAMPQDHRRLPALFNFEGGLGPLRSIGSSLRELAISVIGITG